MRSIVWLGVSLFGVIGAQAATAQVSNSFRGVYAEAQAGGDRFQSQGIHDDKFGYGAGIGFDGVIADKWVIGPQASYWRGRGENRTIVAGGQLSQKSFAEYSVGVRGGYLFTPKLLGYVSGGFARNEQRLAYTGVNGTTTGSAYDRFNTDGYYLGAGAEYSLTSMFYVGAGYRYANYDDHTARQRVFGTVGVRFK